MSKEFATVVLPLQGLRPEAEVHNNTGYLMELRNLVPSSIGLTTRSSITTPTAPKQAWPYPQLHQSDANKAVILGEDYAALYDTEEGPQAIAYTGSIEASGPWHVWGLPGEHFVATNGRTVLAYTEATKLASQAAGVNTLAEQDGMLLAGGLTGDVLTSARLATLFEHWKTYSTNVYAEGTVLGSDWLLWMSVKDISAPEEVLLYMLGLLDDSNEEVVKSLIERRLVGFERVPNGRSIMSIRPIAARFAIYAQRGVYSFSPTDTGMRIAAVHPLGVASRGAVCGDLDHHYIVTADKVLRKYSQNGTYSRLGYREYIKQLSLEDIVVSMDPDGPEYYISDGARSYVYTEQGMYEHTQSPTALMRVDERLLGFYKGEDIDEFYLHTCETDLGFRGMKTIRYIEVMANDVADLRAAIAVRYTTGQDPFLLPWRAGSPEGVFYIGASVINFAILLKGRFTSEEGKIERVHVRFQYSDKRSVRGPRVSGYERGEGEDSSV